MKYRNEIKQKQNKTKNNTQIQALDNTLHPLDKCTLEQSFPTSRLTLQRVQNPSVYGSEPWGLGVSIALNRKGH